MPSRYISVVIATYKRPALLRRCLSALMVQRIAAKHYEIIVVDDGADTQTAAVVRSFQLHQFPVVRYISMNQHRGPGAARNVGWKAAKGAIIAFTDDDTIPDEQWLKEGLAVMQKTHAAAAAGKVLVPVTEPMTDYEKVTSKLSEVNFVTANCFYTKTVLEEVGGFDDRFATAWREDSDLYFTLLERGKKTVLAPTAIVIHPVRNAFWGISILEQKKSMYNALLYKKHHQLYTKTIQATPPLHYYVIVAATCLMLIGIILQKPTLTYASLVLVLVFIGNFFLARIKTTSHALSHIGEMLLTSVLVPYLSVFWRLYGAVRYKVLFF